MLGMHSINYRLRPRGWATAALVPFVLLLAGCAGSGASASAASSATAAANPTPSAATTPASGAATASASTPAAAASSPSAAITGQTVQVLYAGSLVNLMEKGIGPAFQKATGARYLGQGAGSVALANAIKDRTKFADVFISADPTVNASLMGPPNGSWVSWYVLFARTSMVLGYNAHSKFAADFQKAKAGSLPWYQVLEEPGLRLGRTDPNLDPKGYHTLFLFDLAQGYYHLPDLGQKVLGADSNPAQIFPEETLVSRLQSGALDAGFFYLNEAVEQNIPYITLPDEINQSQPSLAATYARVSWTSSKGHTVKGSPILYTATTVSQSKYPAAAAAFIKYLLSADGQKIMQQHGLLPSPVLYGGSEAQMPASLHSLVKGQYSG